jgi:adenine deaminase
MYDLDSLKSFIDTAKGERRPALLLKNARMVNVMSGEVYNTNIAIDNGLIVGVGADYKEAHELIDLDGNYAIPGLINSHTHLESSLLTPEEYARAVLPHGTTTIIIDPHEISNVLGMSGIRYIMEAGKKTPLNIYIMASSCVPATELETSGARFTANEIEELLRLDNVIGIAEMMDVPGLLNKGKDELDKVLVGRRAKKPIDGHSPMLTGKALNAYIGVGIRSEHEATRADEALEKLRLGMYIMIREGSAARNLEELLKIVDARNYRRCLLVTDDKEPQDILEEGEVDYIIKKAVRLGLDPIMAVQMATINPAEAFSLKDLGAIAPGYRADIAVVEDLEEFKVRLVIKDGRIVVRDGSLSVNIQRYSNISVKNKINVGPLDLNSFKIRLNGNRAKVIGITEDQVITKKLIKDVKKAGVEVVADIDNDILKIAVIERHRATGNIGLGLLYGFGLKRGALGSSVAHDSHNLIIIGANDEDMLLAARKLIDMGGGFIAVSDGEVLDALDLPIAGLISDQPLEYVAKKDAKLREIARGLGVKPHAPFMTMSFLALPVIPALKITDKGLVDVDQFKIVSLEADE